MKRIIILLILFLLCLILVGCAIDKEYNNVAYQKNHDYYYLNNEEFIKNYYHYDLYPNYQFKKKVK